MISEDEPDAQEEFPDLRKVEQSNLDKNLIHISTNDIMIQTNKTIKERILPIVIKTLYGIAAIITFGIGLFLMGTISDIKHYTLIFSYVFMYTFIWPIAILVTCIIVGLYHLLFKHYTPTGLTNNDINMTTFYDTSPITEIGEMLMMIFLLFSYLISIPYDIAFVIKILPIRHLYNEQTLILFMIFFICNIVALIMFIVITYLNYQKRKAIHENEKKIDLDEQKMTPMENTIIDNDINQAQKNNGTITHSEDNRNKDKHCNKNRKDIIGIKPDDSMSMRSQCSIHSGKEIDMAQIEKDKRLLQREKILQKIQLNILQEIDEEDERKNRFLERIHEQIKNEKKAKDDGVLSKEIKLEKVYDFDANKETNRPIIRKQKTSITGLEDLDKEQYK